MEAIEGFVQDLESTMMAIAGSFAVIGVLGLAFVRHAAA